MPLRCVWPASARQIAVTVIRYGTVRQALGLSVNRNEKLRDFPCETFAEMRCGRLWQCGLWCNGLPANYAEFANTSPLGDVNKGNASLRDGNVDSFH